MLMFNLTNWDLAVTVSQIAGMLTVTLTSGVHCITLNQTERHADANSNPTKDHENGCES